MLDWGAEIKIIGTKYDKRPVISRLSRECRTIHAYRKLAHRSFATYTEMRIQILKLSWMRNIYTNLFRAQSSPRSGSHIITYLCVHAGKTTYECRPSEAIFEALIQSACAQSL